MDVVIGKTSRSVVGITDLLIHLAADQMDKKLQGNRGEDLNVSLGSIPVGDKEDKARVKKNIWAP